MNQIEQAAGRCDQNFNAARKRAHLPVDRYAADRRRDLARADVTAIGAEAVDDLSRQFTRRRKHQYAAGFLRGTLTLVEEMIQDRQRESRGLARACLRDADDVAVLARKGDGLGLNRGWSDVFL